MTISIKYEIWIILKQNELHEKCTVSSTWLHEKVTIQNTWLHGKDAVGNMAAWDIWISKHCVEENDLALDNASNRLFFMKPYFELHLFHATTYFEPQLFLAVMYFVHQLSHATYFRLKNHWNFIFDTHFQTTLFEKQLIMIFMRF